MTDTATLCEARLIHGRLLKDEIDALLCCREGRTYGHNAMLHDDWRQVVEPLRDLGLIDPTAWRITYLGRTVANMAAPRQ